MRAENDKAVMAGLSPPANDALANGILADGALGAGAGAPAAAPSGALPGPPASPPGEAPPDPLLASPLFDDGHYSRVAGVAGSHEGLLTHYLQHGEARGLSPSPAFEPAFYAMLYPDVVAAGCGLLRHYVVWGHGERRYPTRAALAADAASIEESGLFDEAAFARHLRRAPRAGLSLAEECLALNDGALRIGQAFDSAFYQRAYADVRASGIAPLLHYVRAGWAERRAATSDALQDRAHACRPFFHEAFYRSQLPAGTDPPDALEHYLLEGCRMGLDPSPDFSLSYYLRRYPDLTAEAGDLFLHYVRHGRAEGRLGRPDFSGAMQRGSQAFEFHKPTVLIAGHEASRTGAPLLTLNLAKHLLPTHNVVLHLGHGGELHAEFARHCVLLVTCPLTPVDAEFLVAELCQTHSVGAVLLNSAEASLLGPAALHAGLPAVALVHEFASYTLPRGRMSGLADTADRIVTPAALIRDSLQGELHDLRGGPANHVVVRPQGCLAELPGGDGDADLTVADLRAFIGAEPGRTTVVLGVGYVQIRKGVDLFVQAAAEFRALHGPDVRFLWIGANYHPATDLSYGVFVADMVRRLDLEGIVHFLPNQGSLLAAFEVADVFFMPSRLDPFPGVVLEALRAGKPVVCFDRATGLAEHMRDQPGGSKPGRDKPGRGKPGRAVGAAVPFCDVGAAARALSALSRPDEVKRAKANATLAAQQFGFGDYVAYLLGLLDEAHASRAATEAAAAAVEASGLFDVAFHDGGAPAGPGAARRAFRLYAARGEKGLAYASPRPGFHEAAARARSGRPGPALLPGPDGAPPEPTHRCVILDGRPAPPFAGRVGLHIHLHYADLAPLLAANLQAAGCRADLVVTATSDTGRIEAEHAFRAHRGAVRVLRVPNKGRDIGPFLASAGQALRDGGYDVVGHLHGKRSPDSGPTGDKWRTYLLTNLLGLGAGGVQAVLAPFAADPRLGLLFAEDRHCVGWTANRPHADALAARLSPRPALPTAPIFPLGTMFWARPAALAPWWDLGLQPADFPPEPLPHDGTALHAIERMLPAVCEATGHGWCTVFKPGTGW